MDELLGKTLLVLGCGYLGTRLAFDALKKGMRVKAVGRNAARLEEVEVCGAQVFEGRVEETAWHAFAGGEVDYVVNCVSSAGGGLEGYHASYVRGNASLVAWMKRSGFQGVAVYTSSVSVYPDLGGAEACEEGELDPSNERGRLILESERVFLDPVLDGKRFVLRLAGLYGPNRCLTLNTMRTRPAQLEGFGDYFLNLVRIEDVQTAVWACFSRPDEEGVYNIVDDGAGRKREIVNWLAQELGGPVPEFTQEAGSVGQSSRRLGEAGPPANRRVVNWKARQRLAWAPAYPSFKEGFGDLMARGG